MTVHYEIPVEPERHDCPLCGRDSGHHLGCPATLVQHVVEPIEPEAPEGEGVGPDEVDNTEVPVCQTEGCQDAPKPYGGRGPRPKYCAAHGK